MLKFYEFQQMTRKDLIKELKEIDFSILKEGSDNFTMYNRYKVEYYVETKSESGEIDFLLLRNDIKKMDEISKLYYLDHQYSLMIFWYYECSGKCLVKRKTVYTAKTRGEKVVRDCLEQIIRKKC